MTEHTRTQHQGRDQASARNRKYRKEEITVHVPNLAARTGRVNRLRPQFLVLTQSATDPRDWTLCTHAPLAPAALRKLEYFADVLPLHPITLRPRSSVEDKVLIVDRNQIC